MTNVNDETRQTPVLLRGEPTVIRQVVFPLRCFDHLKQTQRMYEAAHGVSLNNSQILTLILEQHAQHFPATSEQLRARREVPAHPFCGMSFRTTTKAATNV